MTKAVNGLVQTLSIVSDPGIPIQHTTQSDWTMTLKDPKGATAATSNTLIVTDTC